MKQLAAIFLCDKSGIMARPWAEAGVTCFCIDIQHSQARTRKNGFFKCEQTGTGKIYYIFGDARSWKPSQFQKDFFNTYKIIFVACFPVCTNLSGSGAQFWENKGLAMLTDGLLLFNSCEQVADWSGAPYCIENPVGCIPTHHRKPDYYFHPWYYGDLYQKYTCLWTGNGFVMPESQYLTKPNGVTQKIWLASPGLDRTDFRSETSDGICKGSIQIKF